MPGFGAISEYAVSESPDIASFIGRVGGSLSVTSLIVPDGPDKEGILVRSTSALWDEMAKVFAADWSQARLLTPEQWEEMFAGAFKRQGFEKVVLTPRSGDLGRDVIATSTGVGSVKIIGSMKAYSPGNVVSYDHVRSLVGVMSMESDVSKGIVATTSDYPPNIMQDRLIAPLLPTRLELLNGAKLQQWLDALRTR